MYDLKYCFFTLKVLFDSKHILCQTMLWNLCFDINQNRKHDLMVHFACDYGKNVDTKLNKNQDPNDGRQLNACY